PTTAAEWVSLSVSALLLLAVVGAVVYAWREEPQGGPRFRVDRGAVATVNGRFHLPVTVTNEGGQAAKQVEVEGRLETGGAPEEPRAVVDYLPSRAQARIVLIFTADPSGASVEVASYQE